MNFPIDEHIVKYFAKVCGDAYKIVGRENTLPHHHPRAHIERAVAESIILSRCKGQNLIDAGGNSVR